MPRIELQPAYVLHQRAYRDTSAIVDIITPEFGRMSVLAKGLKRPKSRFQGMLRAFQPMLVSWTGRGELMTLTQVDIPGKHLQIQASCLSSGLYLNELIIRLLQKFEPQIELFSDYDQTIRRLCKLADDDAQRQCSLQAILRIFEIKLLRGLGYETAFDIEAGTGIPVQPDDDYHYHVEFGPVKCVPKTEDGVVDNQFQNLDSSYAFREKRLSIRGKTLLIMSKPETMLASDDPQLFQETKRLMRIILANRLGPKPLLSRELFSAKT